MTIKLGTLVDTALALDDYVNWLYEQEKKYDALNWIYMNQRELTVFEEERADEAFHYSKVFRKVRLELQKIMGDDNAT